MTDCIISCNVCNVRLAADNEAFSVVSAVQGKVWGRAEADRAAAGTPEALPGKPKPEAEDIIWADFGLDGPPPKRELDLSAVLDHVAQVYNTPAPSKTGAEHGQ